MISFQFSAQKRGNPVIENHLCRIPSNLVDISKTYEIEKFIYEKLASKDYEFKCKFANKLSKKLLEHTHFPRFLTSNKFIIHVIQQIPSNFFSYPLIKLLAILLFKREEFLGANITSTILDLIIHCLQEFDPNANDFTPIFTILSYLLEENQQLITQFLELIPLILSLISHQLSGGSQSPSFLESIVYVLLRYCENSEELDESILPMIVDTLTTLITHSNTLTPSCISQTLSCATFFIFDEKTNEMLKESGFFQNALHNIKWYEDDSILNHALDYFSASIYYSCDEDDQNESLITGFEDFNEFPIIDKLLAFDPKQEDLINSCLIFLIHLFPIKEAHLNEWLSRGIIEYFLQHFDSFSYSEKSNFLELFILFLNTGDIDIILTFVESGLMKLVIDVTEIIEENDTKLSALKMMYKLLRVLDENHVAYLSDFTQEILPLVEESRESTNEHIHDVASAMSDLIAEE